MSNEHKPMVVFDEEMGREYTLEFSRKTVAKAEQAGFDLNKIDTSPMTMIPLLFWSAFLMHHPYMTREQSDKILFEGLGGLSNAEIERLGDLFAVPFKTLIAMDDGEKEYPRKMTVKLD